MFDGFVTRLLCRTILRFIRFYPVIPQLERGTPYLYSGLYGTFTSVSLDWSIIVIRSAEYRWCVTVPEALHVPFSKASCVIAEEWSACTETCPVFIAWTLGPRVRIHLAAYMC